MPRPPNSRQQLAQQPTNVPQQQAAACEIFSSRQHHGLPSGEVSAFDDSGVTATSAMHTDPSPPAGVVSASTTLSASAAAYVPPQPPHHVPQLADAIFDYLLERCRSLTRNGQYLTTQQSEVTERMRTILFDWLVDVAIKFRLHAETFYLACDITDRFLMTTAVSRSSLQLVGITAVLIAAKHEEIWPPEVRDCVYITANSYSSDDVLDMERNISGALNFRFAVPTVYPVLMMLLNSLSASTRVNRLANYYLEYSSLCYQALQFPIPIVSCATLYLAELTSAHHDAVQTATAQNGGAPLDPAMVEALLAQAQGFVWSVWNENPVYRRATRYADVVAIRECARVLLQFVQVTAPEPRYRAISRKYAHASYGEVSRIFGLPASV